MLSAVVNNVPVHWVHCGHATIASVPGINPNIFPWIRKAGIQFFGRSRYRGIILCASVNGVIGLVQGDVVKFSRGNVVVMHPSQSLVMAYIKSAIIPQCEVIRVVGINP